MESISADPRLTYVLPPPLSCGGPNHPAITSLSKSPEPRDHDGCCSKLRRTARTANEYVGVNGRALSTPWLVSGSSGTGKQRYWDGRTWTHCESQSPQHQRPKWLVPVLVVAAVVAIIVSLTALADAQPIDHQALPFDPVARRLFGLPVVVSLAQAAGVSHTVATGAAAIDTDTPGVGVQWSETSNADDFSTNLIRARCEGRFATSVMRPLAVVKADLTA